MSWRFHAGFGAVTTLLVAAVLSWGFYLVGSPMNRRLERLDQQRLEDLQEIASEIEWMVVDKEDANKMRAELPKTLEEAAKRSRDVRLNLNDPETGEPYGYRVTGKSTYELCATFAKPRESDRGVFWNHAAGKHCFTVDALDLPPVD